ncbi:MAG TPA: hypothetical protein EYP86_00140 [Candidatus Altiarchaeales archaeon]|nr:hypothetical protein [Candidatus Altiarchaeales archaeon]
MEDLLLLLGLLGVIIIIGFLGNVLFSRTRIPEALFLLIVGLIIGPVLSLINTEPLKEISSFVATIALIMILLEAGTSLDIRKLLRNFSHATVFTLMVFILSTGFISLFLYLLMNWPLEHSLILGVISGGTTTITVMALASRCSISEDAKNLLFLESIINDITVISAAVILIQIIKTGIVELTKIGNLILASISIAFLVGFLAGIVWIIILFRYLEKHELNYVATLGIALILYSFIESVGASGAIAVLIFSLTVGNFRNVMMRFRIKTKLITENSLETMKKIKSIQLAMTFFVKTFFFVFLGLIFSFKNLTDEILIIVSVIIIILLIARLFSTEVLSHFDNRYKQDRFLITTMLPRGLTATVVAFLPEHAGIEIPSMIEIVLLMLLLSTIVAIIGAVIQERRFPCTEELKKSGS